MKFIKTLFASLLGAAILAPIAMQGQPQKDNKLYIGGSYFFKEELLHRLADYLTREIPQETEVIIYEKTSKLHKAMKNHQPDILLMNSYSYVLAHKKYPDYTAFSALGQNGKPDSYKSCIITRPQTKLKSLDNLIEEAGRVDFRFVHATSTSGHIVPRYELRRRGLPHAEGKFKSLEFAGGHQQAIMAVINENATAAACGKPSLDYLVKQGQIEKDQYRIIWKSHKIQGAPVVYNIRLPEEIRQNLEQAFLHMPENDPELMEYVRETFHADPQSHFIAISDSAYDVIRDVASSMDDLIMFLNFYMK